jgi:alpha-N-arabinofuranosidase
MPVLDVSVSYDTENGRTAVFMVNRDQLDSVTVTLTWQEGAPRCVKNIYHFTGPDLQAGNTFEQPNALVPQKLPGMPVVDGEVTVALPPQSFTVLVCDLRGCGPSE